MKVSPMYVRYQGPMLQALAKVALATVRGPSRDAAIIAPSPVLRGQVAARPRELVDAYARWSGAAEAKYEHSVPAHMFPQWGFPLLSRTLEGLPYKMTAVLNQGCRLTVGGPLPRGEQIQLEANLQAVEDDSQKIRLHQRLWSGTRARPHLICADVYAVIVKQKAKSEPRTPDTTPYQSLGEWRAESHDGLSFALLTGDFNPIHWIPPYARAAGFKNQILHGFGTFARSWEMLAAHHKVEYLPMCDVRFVRPLVMPGSVQVEIAMQKGQQLFRVRQDDTVVAAGSYSHIKPAGKAAH